VKHNDSLYIGLNCVDNLLNQVDREVVNIEITKKAPAYSYISALELSLTTKALLKSGQEDAPEVSIEAYEP